MDGKAWSSTTQALTKSVDPQESQRGTMVVGSVDSVFKTNFWTNTVTRIRPVYIPQWVLPVADPSAPKGFETANMSACNIGVNGAYSEDPMPGSYSTGTGEVSQASVVASFHSPHPDPHLTLVGLSTGPVRPPSLSVPDQGHVLEGSQCPNSAATLPHPPETMVPGEEYSRTLFESLVWRRQYSYTTPP